jgi:L-lysine exporter family protein LysE/ArgO
VIGTSSLQYAGYEKIAFTFGCALVSCCWFFALSVAGHFIHKLDKKRLWQQWGNKLSAVIIWMVAIYIGWLLVDDLSGRC